MCHIGETHSCPVVCHQSFFLYLTISLIIYEINQIFPVDDQSLSAV